MREKPFAFLTLIVTLLSFSITDINIIYAENGENSPWIITSSMAFSDSDYDVFYNISIESNIEVTFENCSFNFLNETDIVMMQVKENSTLNIINCTLNGLQDQTIIGNFVLNCSNNVSLNLIDSIFNKLGVYKDNIWWKDVSYYGIESIGNWTYIESCTFFGMTCGIKQNHVENTKIIESSFVDSPSESEYKIYESVSDFSVIELFDLGNMHIEKNTINGYAVAIRTTACKENFTIYNNTFNCQSSISMSIDTVCAQNGKKSTTIFKNVINGSKEGLYFEGFDSEIIYNTFNVEQMGCKFYFFGYDNNNTITNNYVKKSIDTNGNFKAFIMSGGVKNLDFTDNQVDSIDNDSNIEFLDMQMYPYITNRVNFTFERNELFGKLVRFYYDISDYSQVVNFAEDDWIGALYILNCTGVTFENLDLHRYGAIHCINSSEVVIQNVNLLNSFEDIVIRSCENCTLKDTNVTIDEIQHLSSLSCYSNKNLTLENLILTGGSEVKNYGTGILFSDVDNSSLMYSEVSGFDNSFEIQSSESNLIKNNSFYAEGVCISNGPTAFFNNYTYNELIKYDFSETNYSVQDYTDNKNYWDRNHWMHYFNANDTNGDNIADEPFVEYYKTQIFAFDNYPLFFDNDNDGLENLVELYYGTNISFLDTDYDGLNDTAEIHQFQTDPTITDTDMDSINDYDEVKVYFTNPNEQDSDGDSFSDNIEILFSSDPNDPNDFPGGIIGDDNSEETDESEGDGEDDKIYSIPGYSLVTLISSVSVIYIIFLEQRRRDL
ncbi:MAG: hypothetical protein GF364_08600 [Candidatus Lokiarchaeota archaeon]|nr:hypothetical protein [Candidatus Lokiarchaeota archaeon]